MNFPILLKWLMKHRHEVLAIEQEMAEITQRGRKLAEQIETKASCVRIERKTKSAPENAKKPQ